MHSVILRYNLIPVFLIIRLLPIICNPFMNQKNRVAIIGAGPAGLTAAYQLSKLNHDVVVFEKDAKYVGGISRTESYKGYHFDIGGHRFFQNQRSRRFLDRNFG